MIQDIASASLQAHQSDEEDESNDVTPTPAAKETKYRRLLSISGTRFIARTRNLRIFHNKLPQIRSALIAMGLGELENSLDSRFSATVSVLHTIMCPISELSQALQSPELNLLGAQDFLQLVRSQLGALRTEAEYDKCIASCSTSTSGSIVDDLPSNSAPCNVPVKTALPSQRKRRPPADLSNFVVMHAMPIFSSTARRSATLTLAEYYEILDMAKQEIDARFDNPVLGTLAALQSGQMTTTLAEFCSLHHRDPEIVGRQLQFTHLALKTNKPDYRCSLPDLFRFSSVQPELHYIVDVALTLPVTSASAERAFSRLRLVKNHLRTTMSSGRLQSLLRISANSSTSFSISLDSMVELFAKSERKILV